MTTTMTMTTSSRPAACGCGGGSGLGCGGGCGGCSCGGSPAAGSAAFTRPRFFAGQLLTEDDLEQLTAYITGKDRLRNRMLSGPGVVSGLDVVCAPCGGGDVVVRPGYALDCCGNEIVVGCPETVSITELVNELRVRGLGVDCGDPCAGGSTSGKAETTGGHATRAPRYGLYVRYAEADAEPVAPYATQEPCPPVSCVPSRIREGFTFLVKCACADPPDHSYRPGDCLLRVLGDLPGTPPAFGTVWSRGRRLDQYRERMRAAAAAEDEDEAIVFTDADAARFTAALDELSGLMNEARKTDPGTGTLEAARQITETVRALAAAVARYDLGAGRQQQLVQRYRDLDRVGQAREVLGSACTWLRTTVEDPVAAKGDPPLPELTWPDPVLRGIAHAVVEQTAAQVVGPNAVPTPMELRLVALGAPLDRPLRSDLRSDLGRLRDWLLIRLETSAELTTCTLRADVAAIAVPLALPQQAQGDDGTVSAGELKDLARAADQVYSALYRFVTDLACGCLLPPPLACTDTDVLLATVEVDDCTVVRICSAGREQVLPGGAAYGAWLAQLPKLRELAGRICCGPVPKDSYVEEKKDGGISLPYGPGWLLGTHISDPGRLLALLGAIPAPQAAATPARLRPAALAAQPAPAAGPAPATAPDPELADLRDRLAAVTARLAVLESRPEPAPVRAAAPAPVPPPAPEPAPAAAPPPEPAPAPSPPPGPQPTPVKRAEPAKKAAAKEAPPAAESTAENKATPAGDDGDQNPGA